MEYEYGSYDVYENYEDYGETTFEYDDGMAPSETMIETVETLQANQPLPIADGQNEIKIIGTATLYSSPFTTQKTPLTPLHELNSLDLHSPMTAQPHSLQSPALSLHHLDFMKQPSYGGYSSSSSQTSTVQDLFDEGKYSTNTQVDLDYTVCGPQETDMERLQLETEVMETTSLSRDTAGMLLRLTKFNKEKVIDAVFENCGTYLEGNHVDTWQSFFANHPSCSESTSTTLQSPFTPLPSSSLAFQFPSPTNVVKARRSNFQKNFTFTDPLFSIFDVQGTLESFKNNPFVNASADPDVLTEEFCGVCFDTPALNRLVTSPCGHKFCLDCWVGYLQSEVQTFKRATRMRCMDPDCKQYIPDSQVKSIVFAALLLSGLNPESSPEAFSDIKEPKSESQIGHSIKQIQSHNSIISPHSLSTSSTASISSISSFSSTNSTTTSASTSSLNSVSALFSPSTLSSSKGRNSTSSSTQEDLKNLQPHTNNTQSLHSPQTIEEEETSTIPIEELWSKYWSLLRRAFSDEKRNLMYCPNPECTYVIKGSLSTTTAVCRCGTTMCFKCGHGEDHMPLSCADLVTWSARCQRDSETAQWIMFNTRKCPKCRARIEKNAGCNHMTCTNCSYEFCWVCDGDWLEHLREAKNTASAYRCNRFDVKKAISTEGKDDQPSETTKESGENSEEAQRYFFYFSRYHAMESMKKHVIQNQATIERHVQKLLEKEDGRFTAYDANTLREGNDTLVLARRMLQYSYAFLFMSNQSKRQLAKREVELFEFLQERLEQNSEQLYAHVYEKNMRKINPQQIRNRVAATRDIMESMKTQYFVH